MTPSDSSLTPRYSFGIVSWWLRLRNYDKNQDNINVQFIQAGMHMLQNQTQADGSNLVTKYSQSAVHVVFHSKWKRWRKWQVRWSSTTFDLGKSLDCYVSNTILIKTNYLPWGAVLVRTLDKHHWYYHHFLFIWIFVFPVFSLLPVPSW